MILVVDASALTTLKKKGDYIVRRIGCLIKKDYVRLDIGVCESRF
jgi:hypothetical protein